jgi:hypothetical protein
MARADWEVFTPLDEYDLPQGEGFFNLALPFTLSREEFPIYPGGGPHLVATLGDNEDGFSQISLLRTAEDGVVGAVGVSGSFVIGVERSAIEGLALFTNVNFAGNLITAKTPEEVSEFFKFVFTAGEFSPLETIFSLPGVSVFTNPIDIAESIISFGPGIEDEVALFEADEPQAVVRIEFYLTRLSNGDIGFGSRGFRLTELGFSAVPAWAVDFSLPNPDEELFPVLGTDRNAGLTLFGGFFREDVYAPVPSVHIDTIRFSRFTGELLYSGTRKEFTLGEI